MDKRNLRKGRCITILKNSVRKKEELLQRIKKFRLLDDELMSRVFDENIECTELVLRIILGRPDIKVSEVHTQSEIKNLLGHSVRLDIDAKSSDGEPMDVEIQRAEKGAEPKRARYNSSMMDANTLVRGEDYDRLPESYVIFITETDVMGGSLPVYHMDRVIKETGQPFRDGAHIIYVNGAYRDDSPIGKLMHDFSCSEPEDMYYKELAEQVKYYKENEKGVAAMSKIMEDFVEELLEQEKKEDKVKYAIQLKKLGKLTNEEIALSLGMTIKEVEEVDESAVVLI